MSGGLMAEEIFCADAGNFYDFARRPRFVR